MLESLILNPARIAEASAVGGAPPDGLAKIQERIRRHPELMHQLSSITYPENCRKRVREICREFSADYGVVCFSRARTSILMWSHYAAKHTGIVIGFELPVEVSTQLLEVDYSPERVLFDPTQPIGEEYTEAFSRQMISTKHADWHYEEETRLLVELSKLDPPTERPDGKRLHLMRFGPKLIKSISLGMRCSDETTAKVLDAVQKNKLAAVVERAAPHDHNFEVRFGPLGSNDEQ